MKSRNVFYLLVPATFGSALIWAYAAGGDLHESTNSADHRLVRTKPRAIGSNIGTRGDDDSLADYAGAPAASVKPLYVQVIGNNVKSSAHPAIASKNERAIELPSPTFGLTSDRIIELPQPMFGQTPGLDLPPSGDADSIEPVQRNIESLGYTNVVHATPTQHHPSTTTNSAGATLALPNSLGESDQTTHAFANSDLAEREAALAMTAPSPLSEVVRPDVSLPAISVEESIEDAALSYSAAAENLPALAENKPEPSANLVAARNILAVPSSVLPGDKLHPVGPPDAVPDASVAPVLGAMPMLPEPTFGRPEQLAQASSVPTATFLTESSRRTVSQGEEGLDAARPSTGAELVSNQIVRADSGLPLLQRSSAEEGPQAEHSAYAARVRLDDMQGSGNAAAESANSAAFAGAPSAPPLAAVSAEAAASGLPAARESVAPLAQARNVDLWPGRQTFPSRNDGAAFTIDDQLILQLKVRGIEASDTIIAYGTRDGVFLPVGELAVILDLAIRVSDAGRYASGWFLSEDRTVTIDLRQGLLTISGRTTPIDATTAQAFEGELYVRSDILASILPLDFEPNLRLQAVLLTTREPFPFEERMRREASRSRLAQRGGIRSQRESWPREETPWLALSFPITDVELRAVSDSQMGSRTEGDLRVAGDFAWMTGEAYLSATSRDGLVSSLLSVGRRDIDRQLLGPLQASEFQFGDVATTPMPLGLRGAAGRGAYVTNTPFDTISVFDRVDLRGVLLDGYEVELYRNDVLLGSSADAVNGQYEFLEVPVDYGLNVFRIVFYGPQGQRREEVRRISVGDGRLAPGEFKYSFGAIQNDTNLLGVERPNFRPGVRTGDWQAVGEVAYGFNSAVTGVASGAFFEDDAAQRWLVTTGLRTGIGGFAVRADVGAANGGGHAAGLGVGGSALGGAFALTHFQYGGPFVDEVRSFSGQPLRQATEFDFNASLGFASSVIGTALPISVRARHLEFADSRKQFSAALRASARLEGLIASNTFEYNQSSTPGFQSFSQLAGDFNLATFSQSRTQVRGAIGYRILPDLALVQVSAGINHAIDDRTVVNASAAYSIANSEFSVGASAIREFERFTLALDGQYAPQQGTYAVALRIGFSFGREPLRQRLFVSSPGLASSGALALRAFQDLDGDLTYSPGDVPLPAVDFAAFNSVATTSEEGYAMLGDLGDGIPVAVQVDLSSLPDISMAPARRGVEIVPRRGRFHTLEFPITEVSEIEGSVNFVDGDSKRGVSGLRLQLRDVKDGTEYWTRTERGGYFFYEQVLPGNYQVLIDPEQSERLGICLDTHEPITVEPRGNIIERDLSVRICDQVSRQVN